MKRVLIAVVAAVVCCLLPVGLCQDLPDIYHGCYFDGVERLLRDLITCTDGVNVCQESCGSKETYCEGETDMTVEFCRVLCRSRNLQYYALQTGKQCFCGGALSEPFKYEQFSGDPSNCSYPCSGDANQTCGGDFKMEVYEFNETVQEADCFHPGFVPNSYVSENLAPKIGEHVIFICEPGHMIIGDSQLTCQAERKWSPNVLPVCNYTGIFPTEPPEIQTTADGSTTPAKTTAKEVSPTTLPLMTITDFLPYIIGGSAALLFILVVCMVAIFTCRLRNRSGNARQNIRLKPESAPVTFINAGFNVEDEVSLKHSMPDILSASGNLPQSPDHSFMENQYRKDNRMSTFAEEAVYQNGNVIDSSSAKPEALYANQEDESVPLSPHDNPPSPVYANAEEVLPRSEPEYNRQFSGNGYATTDHPNTKRGSSSDDPVFVYATGNRRAKKNATGTKDLAGWSRPSSLYQRTTLADSDEDNIGVDPEQLNDAVYALVDKSRLSGSRETLNTTSTSEDGNSFFADPAKTSATRL